MRGFFEKIFKKLEREFARHGIKQRWLFVIFEDEQATLRLYIFHKNTNRLESRGSLSVKNVSEKNVASSRLLRVLGYLLFFPFHYHVAVVTSRAYCSSKYFTIAFSRISPHAPVEKGEMGAALSQTLWKALEYNKKEFADDRDLEDLNVLLVNNQIVHTSVDSVPLRQPDSLFEKGGKKVVLGIVQTFIYRPLFSGLLKTFPKRASFKYFYEDGFSLALTALRAQLISGKTKGSKKAVMAMVEERDTHTYVFDGATLAYYDSFNFGTRDLYEALNHASGIGYGAYQELLGRIIGKNMSPYADKAMRFILDDELGRLLNGVASIKKDTGAAVAYINGGQLNSFLKTHKRLAPMAIDDSILLQCADIPDIINLDIPRTLKADIACALGLGRNDELNILATRQIRWLIPHNVDVR